MTVHGNKQVIRTGFNNKESSCGRCEPLWLCTNDMKSLSFSRFCLIKLQSKQKYRRMSAIFTSQFDHRDDPKLLTICGKIPVHLVSNKHFRHRCRNTRMNCLSRGTWIKRDAWNIKAWRVNKAWRVTSNAVVAPCVRVRGYIACNTTVQPTSVIHTVYQ